jgi:TonB family protein
VSHQLKFQTADDRRSRADNADMAKRRPARMASRGRMKPLVIGVVFTLGLVSPMLARPDDTIYKPGNGVSWPKLVTDIKPQYTADALRRRVSGAVILQCVIDREGVSTNVEVVRSLDQDLDQAALKTLKQWRFEPGKKDGRPVLVQIPVEMVFTMAKRKRWRWLGRD